MANEEILQIYSELKTINERLNKLENKGIAATQPRNEELPNTPQKKFSYGEPQVPTPTNWTKKNDTPSEDHAAILQALGKAPKNQTFFPSENYSSSETPSMSMGSIVGAIGIICFIFGAALIVHMAIQNGWLNPFRQWGLVGLLGIVMSIVGLYFKNTDNEYIGYLTGSSTVVLYFAAYSGSQIFKIYDTDISIMLVALITSYCLWLHQYFQNQLFGVTAAIGAYTAPLILGHNDHNFEVIAAYFCIWTFAFATLSAWLRSRTLTLLSAYLGIGVFAVINLNKSANDELMFVVIIQAIQFLTLLGGVVYYSVKFDEPMEEGEVWSFFPALLFFYATEYFFLNNWVPGIAPWVSLGFAGLLLAAHRFAASEIQNNYKLNSEKMILSFCAIVAFHSVYLNLLPEMTKPYLVMLIVALGVYAHTQDKIKRDSNGIILLLLAIICLIEFAKICFGLRKNEDPFILIPAVGTLFALFSAYAYVVRDKFQEESMIFLGIVHFLAVLSLYNLTTGIGSLAVSISWGVYALVILGVSYSLRDWRLNKSSITVLLLAAFKALIYDAANASTEVRIVCLLLTGALLYGAGFLFRKASSLENG